MGVYTNPYKDARVFATRVDRDKEVSKAIKDLDNICLRRFIKPSNKKALDINENEYKRVENFLKQMSKRQKGLLYEIHRLVRVLETKHSSEREVLDRCFKNANDLELFKLTKLKNHDQWIEAFSDVMTPWAEWFEETVSHRDDIYYLDVFWDELQKSECLWYMLDACCLVQQLEIIDGRMLKFLEMYDITLANNPWYELHVSDRLVQKLSWIGEMVYVEQLMVGSLRNILEDFVKKEKLNAIDAETIVPPPLQAAANKSF
ncbi:hypothetical protein GNI_046840 [Gregarina niphandrodes]|uniref:Uncharacterized protein n=1 Tax=Gregarina niphandrodes TaxID=110365 RepID=A0A023B9W4_GRENI|nr:hypothetical protein GNI_046840 [Gregarina niphandrodes]EZG74928.1 hypothetical protein GNI_046840 [Gregarina niphandrodes]|eukprot:XP_011129618.1 hypothetical protein GNI_046840 [Gregarina niphandrodes]